MPDTSHPSAPAAEERVDPPSAPESHASEAQAESATEIKQLDTKNQESPDDKKEESRPESPEAEKADEEDACAPPLPDEVPPPLPDEAPPAPVEDDGWEPVWDPNHNAYYFYNRFTGSSQWDNPRVPTATATATAPGVDASTGEPPKKKAPVLGGYNPAIHGDYDPTAPYAQLYEEQTGDASGSALDPAAAYAATGTFNRFTGRWQAASINPENHNDENKSRRQLNAFFDVDAAANAHDGRSLRAERSAKKLSKKELKMFKEKRREKKEEKRRAWLRD